MAKKVLVGISTGNIPTGDWGDGKFQLDRDGQGRLYSEAVAQAGGLPLLIPMVRTVMGELEEGFSSCGPGNLHDNARIYMEHLDALLLSGGGDIAPQAGAAKPEHYRLVDRPRDIWESALLAAALDMDKPVLGICRGLQLINAALGGSLWSDLPEERPGPVEHTQTLPRARATHGVEIEAGSRLASIVKFDQIMVNSGHHQGLKDLAPALRVAAKAPDGLTEAAEHRQARFVLGVQWHPEGQLAADHSRALFAALVEAAEKR